MTASVKTSPDYPVPETMKAWVLGDPGELAYVDKPVPTPGRAEVLVRIDAVAICATDLEIIYHGPPALIQGGAPHNKNFTPGHEYMGTVVALGEGVDEYAIGDRVTVEIHAGCGQCKRCRQGMYTSCHNYGLNYGNVDKGHRANGFTTNGGFAEYAVNNINTLARVPDAMSDEEATLVVTAASYWRTHVRSRDCDDQDCPERRGDRRNDQRGSCWLSRACGVHSGPSQVLAISERWGRNHHQSSVRFRSPVAFGYFTRAVEKKVSAPRTTPTAMPVAPLIRRLGIRAGRTTGSWRCASNVSVKATVSRSMSASSSSATAASFASV